MSEFNDTLGEMRSFAPPPSESTKLAFAARKQDFITNDITGSSVMHFAARDFLAIRSSKEENDLARVKQEAAYKNQQKRSSEGVGPGAARNSASILEDSNAGRSQSPNRNSSPAEITNMKKKKTKKSQQGTQNNSGENPEINNNYSSDPTNPYAQYAQRGSTGQNPYSQPNTEALPALNSFGNSVSNPAEVAAAANKRSTPPPTSLVPSGDQIVLSKTRGISSLSEAYENPDTRTLPAVGPVQAVPQAENNVNYPSSNHIVQYKSAASDSPVESSDNKPIRKLGIQKTEDFSVAPKQQLNISTTMTMDVTSSDNGSFPISPTTPPNYPGTPYLLSKNKPPETENQNPEQVDALSPQNQASNNFMANLMCNNNAANQGEPAPRSGPPLLELDLTKVGHKNQKKYEFDQRKSEERAKEKALEAAEAAAAIIAIAPTAAADLLSKEAIRKSVENAIKAVNVAQGVPAQQAESAGIIDKPAVVALEPQTTTTVAAKPKVKPPILNLSKAAAAVTIENTTDQPNIPNIDAAPAKNPNAIKLKSLDTQKSLVYTTTDGHLLKKKSVDKEKSTTTDANGNVVTTKTSTGRKKTMKKKETAKDKFLREEKESIHKNLRGAFKKVKIANMWSTQKKKRDKEGNVVEEEGDSRTPSQIELENMLTKIHSSKTLIVEVPWTKIEEPVAKPKGDPLFPITDEYAKQIPAEGIEARKARIDAEKEAERLAKKREKRHEKGIFTESEDEWEIEEEGDSEVEDEIVNKENGNSESDKRITLSKKGSSGNVTVNGTVGGVSDLSNNNNNANTITITCNTGGDRPSSSQAVVLGKFGKKNGKAVSEADLIRDFNKAVKLPKGTVIEEGLPLVDVVNKGVKSGKSAGMRSVSPNGAKKVSGGGGYGKKSSKSTSKFAAKKFPIGKNISGYSQSLSGFDFNTSITPPLSNQVTTPIAENEMTILKEFSLRDSYAEGDAVGNASPNSYLSRNSPSYQGTPSMRNSQQGSPNLGPLGNIQIPGFPQFPMGGLNSNSPDGGFAFFGQQLAAFGKSLDNYAKAMKILAQHGGAVGGSGVAASKYLQSMNSQAQQGMRYTSPAGVTVALEGVQEGMQEGNSDSLDLSGTLLDSSFLSRSIDSSPKNGIKPKQIQPQRPEDTESSNLSNETGQTSVICPEVPGQQQPTLLEQAVQQQQPTTLQRPGQQNSHQSYNAMLDPRNYDKFGNFNPIVTSPKTAPNMRTSNSANTSRSPDSARSPYSETRSPRTPTSRPPEIIVPFSGFTNLSPTALSRQSLRRSSKGGRLPNNSSLSPQHASRTGKNNNIRCGKCFNCLTRFDMERQKMWAGAKNSGPGSRPRGDTERNKDLLPPNCKASIFEVSMNGFSLPEDPVFLNQLGTTTPAIGYGNVKNLEKLPSQITSYNSGYLKPEVEYQVVNPVSGKRKSIKRERQSKGNYGIGSRSLSKDSVRSGMSVALYNLEKNHRNGKDISGEMVDIMLNRAQSSEPDKFSKMYQDCSFINNKPYVRVTGSARDDNENRNNVLAVENGFAEIRRDSTMSERSHRCGRCAGCRSRLDPEWQKHQRRRNFNFERSLRTWGSTVSKEYNIKKKSVHTDRAYAGQEPWGVVPGSRKPVNERTLLEIENGNKGGIPVINKDHQYGKVGVSEYGNPMKIDLRGYKQPGSEYRQGSKRRGGGSLRKKGRGSKSPFRGYSRSPDRVNKIRSQSPLLDREPLRMNNVGLSFGRDGSGSPRLKPTSSRSQPGPQIGYKTQMGYNQLPIGLNFNKQQQYSQEQIQQMQMQMMQQQQMQVPTGIPLKMSYSTNTLPTTVQKNSFNQNQSPLNPQMFDPQLYQTYYTPENDPRNRRENRMGNNPAMPKTGTNGNRDSDPKSKPSEFRSSEPIDYPSKSGEKLATIHSRGLQSSEDSAGEDLNYMNLVKELSKDGGREMIEFAPDKYEYGSNGATGQQKNLQTMPLDTSNISTNLGSLGANLGSLGSSLTSLGINNLTGGKSKGLALLVSLDLDESSGNLVLSRLGGGESSTSSLPNQGATQATPASIPTAPPNFQTPNVPYFSTDRSNSPERRNSNPNVPQQNIPPQNQNLQRSNSPFRGQTVNARTYSKPETDLPRPTNQDYQMQANMIQSQNGDQEPQVRRSQPETRLSQLAYRPSQPENHRHRPNAGSIPEIVSPLSLYQNPVVDQNQVRAPPPVPIVQSLYKAYQPQQQYPQGYYEQQEQSSSSQGPPNVTPKFGYATPGGGTAGGQVSAGSGGTAGSGEIPEDARNSISRAVKVSPFLRDQIQELLLNNDELGPENPLFAALQQGMGSG